MGYELPRLRLTLWSFDWEGDISARVALSKTIDHGE